MRLLILILFLLPSVALARTSPAIEGCSKVELSYTLWAWDMRKSVDKRSSDRNGPIDASLIKDINFALVTARDFVHESIKNVQRSALYGKVPSVRECQTIKAIAQNQIEQYIWALLNDIRPEDRWARQSLLDEYRLGLQQTARQFRGN